MSGSHKPELAIGHFRPTVLGGAESHGPKPRGLNHPRIRGHAGTDPPHAAQEVRDPHELEKRPGVEDR